MQKNSYFDKYLAPILANISLGQKQAFPEAMLESVASGKFDYIEKAKQNGTYVPGKTEVEAERVAKGVLADNLMFLTATDTLQDALIAATGAAGIAEPVRSIKNDTPCILSDRHRRIVVEDAGNRGWGKAGLLG